MEYEETEKRTLVWEGQHDRLWEDLEETDTGRLVLRENDRSFAKRRRFVDTSAIKRRMLRAVVIIVDASKAASISDMKPTRLMAATESLIDFTKSFFDENPLSSMGILCTRRGEVERLCEFTRSAKAVADSLLVLQTARSAEGSASLQNSLELAHTLFKFIPDYIEREIIIVASAMSVVDPSDIFETIEKLKGKQGRGKSNIRCSTIHLCGLVEIYRKLAEQTNGTFSVARDKKHLDELLVEHITPPPSTEKTCHMVRMAFPSQSLSGTRLNAQPAYCLDTGRIQLAPYYCPICSGATSSLPATCRTCQVTLISSSHLARSHHHLFPVDNYTVLSNIEIDSQTQCNACQIQGRPANIASTEEFFSKCPKCNWTFCRYCDDLVHDTLFVCPGCVQ